MNELDQTLNLQRKDISSIAFADELYINCDYIDRVIMQEHVASSPFY